MNRSTTMRRALSALLLLTLLFGAALALADSPAGEAIEATHEALDGHGHADDQGHDGAHGESHGPSTVLIIATLVNFFAFAGLIAFFTRKPINAYFARRREEIVANIAASKALQDEAEAQLNEYQEKLEQLDREREKVLEEFRAIGKAEAERLVSEAKASAERIREDARKLAEQEGRAARAGIEAQMVDRALELATEELNRRINPMVQNKLIEQSIERFKSMNAN